ncbi:helix-turn-helix domain-containing protein [Streptomyces sp. NPDC056061]|uniref:helix-turn-helix domain-containing protein n=1 Tax=Streptomyces sp. NPDC056061 TaxID=3345700 RepID=UPI0035E112A1
MLDLVANARPADTAHRDCRPLPAPPLPTSPEALAAARTLLQNPSHGAGVVELAQSAGVGVRTLQQQFLKETGLPFARWRTAARVATAASLLGLGHDIGWTGRQVGFSTPAGFTAELGVDARTLGHDFIAATGQTYAQRRDQLRMNLARQYLEERMPTGQAARKLGYADASALTRVFTRAHGMSPREYRRYGWQHTEEELILQ